MSMFAFAGKKAKPLLNSAARASKTIQAGRLGTSDTQKAHHTWSSILAVAGTSTVVCGGVFLAVAQEASHSGLSDRLDLSEESFNAKLQRTLSYARKRRARLREEQQLELERKLGLAKSSELPQRSDQPKL